MQRTSAARSSRVPLPKVLALILGWGAFAWFVMQVLVLWVAANVDVISRNGPFG